MNFQVAFAFLAAILAVDNCLGMPGGLTDASANDETVQSMANFAVAEMGADYTLVAVTRAQTQKPMAAIPDQPQSVSSLLDFLEKERGVDKETIDLLKHERIDESTLPLMTDEELKTFLPSIGDRIAARKFCERKTDKKSLIDRLREKFVKTRQVRGVGNSNAAKQERKVEVGWLDFRKDISEYKQVRTQGGGGTRIIPFAKTDKAKEVLEKSISVFFPNGMSKRGPEANYDFHLCDFLQNKVDDDKTISDLYMECNMRTLRLYVSSRRKDEEEADEILPDIQRPKKRKIPRKQTPINKPDTEKVEEFQDKRDESDLNSSHVELGTTACVSTASEYHYQDSDVSPDTDLSVTEKAEELPDKRDKSSLNSPHLHVQLDPTASFPSGEEYHYQDADVSFVVPWYAYNQMPSLDLNMSQHAVSDNMQHTPDLVMAAHSSLSYTDVGADTESLVESELNIHRGPMAFHELISFFKDKSINENSKFRICRILPNGEKEQAEDFGGVLRDLLTEFWNSFYELCTLGRQSKVPSLRHDFGSVEWEAVGRILVYGYTVTGYWPVLLSRSFITHTLLPETEINTDVLLQDFYSFVSTQDMDVLKQVLQDFNSVDKDELLETLDMYDCKSIPGPENIKPIVLEIAHTHLIQKPMFICNSMQTTVSQMRLTEEELEKLYSRVIPSNKKVVNILKFPEDMDTQQCEIAKHLRRYIRDIDQEKLKLFLRFCTGSDLLTIDEIKVEFIQLEGLARRPIAHTCGCVLQLSRSYENFIQFRSEFDSVLSQNVWVMDMI